MSNDLNFELGRFLDVMTKNSDGILLTQTSYLLLVESWILFPTLDTKEMLISCRKIKPVTCVLQLLIGQTRVAYWTSQLDDLECFSSLRKRGLFLPRYCVSRSTSHWAEFCVVPQFELSTKVKNESKQHQNPPRSQGPRNKELWKQKNCRTPLSFRKKTIKIKILVVCLNHFGRRKWRKYFVSWCSCVHKLSCKSQKQEIRRE